MIVMQLTIFSGVAINNYECPAICWFDLKSRRIYEFFVTKSIANPCFQFLISIFLCQNIHVFFATKNVHCWKVNLYFSHFFWLVKNELSLELDKKRTFSNQNMIKHKFVIRTFFSSLLLRMKQKMFLGVSENFLVGCGFCAVERLA